MYVEDKEKSNLREALVVRQIERRICPNCTRSFPASSAFFRINSRTGIATGKCKKCTSKKGTVQEQERKNDPRITALRYIKRNAKLRGLEFNITPDDLIIPDFCPILGIKLYWTKGIATNSTPSIDRIDPSKGYIKGNVQVISMRANTLKNNATVEELELILKFIKK